MGQKLSYLIEIFLPLTTNEGELFGRAPFGQVRDELVERFGGVTLFTRSPAEGLWAGDDGEAPTADQMVTVEVMAEDVDEGWWAQYRQMLEQRFRQEEVLIRCYEVRRL